MVRILTDDYHGLPWTSDYDATSTLFRRICCSLVDILFAWTSYSHSFDNVLFSHYT